MLSVLVHAQIQDQEYTKTQETDETEIQALNMGLQALQGTLSKLNNAVGTGIPNATHSGPLTLQ